MNRALGDIQKGMERTAELAKHLAEAFVLREVFEATKGALEYAGALREQSAQMGLTTKDLQVYRFAASQAGVTNDELEVGVRKLTSSLGKAQVGAEQQGKIFDALGLSVRDASGHLKTADDIIPQLADKLAKISSPTERAAVEVGLLGKSGQKFDPLFREGAAGIAEFAKQAQDAGLIISDEVAKKAEDAAHKIAMMTQELKVNFSNEVAENAGAILGLANALEHLTIGALHFISTYPRLAGALAGATVGALRGGIPGAIIGGGAGLVTGELGSRNAANSNTDLAFRQKQLADAVSEMRARQSASKSGAIFGLRHSTADGGNLQSSVAEVVRQTALLRNATALARASRIVTPTVPEVELPDYLGGKGGGRAKHAAAPRKDPLADADLRFGEELAHIDDQILQAKKASLTDIDAITAIDKQMVFQETVRANLAVDKEVADKRITDTQGKQLKAENDVLAIVKTINLDREAQAEHIRRQSELETGLLGNKIDQLHLEQALAITTDDRRRLALDILDEEKKQARIQAQTTLDLFAKGQATAEQAQIARDTLKNLDTNYGLKRQDVIQQTRSPLDQYLADNDPKLIGEKVQRAYVDELEAVKHGIDDAITNALGINDPFLKSIIDLFIQQVLIDPIAQALQSHMGSGGGLGGLLSGIGSIFGGGGGLDVAGAISGGSAALDSLAVIPAFASGTDSAPGGLSWVGEHGKELMNVPKGAQIFPANVSAMMARNDNSPNVEAHFHYHGQMSERERRETTQQAMRDLRREMGRSVRLGG